MHTEIVEAEWEALERIDQFNEAWNARDLDGVMAMMTMFPAARVGREARCTTECGCRNCREYLRIDLHVRLLVAWPVCFPGMSAW